MSVSESNRGFHIGDSCVDGCSIVIRHSFCSPETKTCQCLDTHPIVVGGVACLQRESNLSQ
jgi:hypothetical protein